MDFKPSRKTFWPHGGLGVSRQCNRVDSCYTRGPTPGVLGCPLCDECRRAIGDGLARRGARRAGLAVLGQRSTGGGRARRLSCSDSRCLLDCGGSARRKSAASRGPLANAARVVTAGATNERRVRTVGTFDAPL